MYSCLPNETTERCRQETSSLAPLKRFTVLTEQTTNQHCSSIQWMPIDYHIGRRKRSEKNPVSVIYLIEMYLLKHSFGLNNGSNSCPPSLQPQRGWCLYLFLPSSLFLSLFSVTCSSSLSDVICTQFDRTIRVIEVRERRYPSMFHQKGIQHTTKLAFKIVMPPMLWWASLDLQRFLNPPQRKIFLDVHWSDNFSNLLPQTAQVETFPCIWLYVDLDREKDT